MTDSLVDPIWLAQHLDDPNICLIEFDWDGQESYDAGHIPGALGFNWKLFLWDSHTREFPSPAGFASRLADIGITNETTVVVYGDPVQFGTYAWWAFKYCGHEKVALLDGGKLRWRNEGRPLVTDVLQPSPTRYTPMPRDETIRVLRDDVLNTIGSDSIAIVDHRSLEEYSGQRVGLPGKPDVGAERSGRIPGAIHMPFDNLIAGDGTFKPASELLGILSERGITPDHQVISYCRLSHRATLAAFAMTEILGYKSVRVYDGSWTEWGSLVGVPIER